MENSLYSVSAFLTVFALAIISPGPNFVLVVNSAVGESREHSLLTAFGVATGSFLFALAGLFGLLVLVTSWPPLNELLVYLGGGYLFWIGATMLLASLRRRAPVPASVTQPVALRVAYRRGLLTNLSNPKAWAFYLSLFSLMVAPDSTVWGKLLLAVSMFLISFTWYAVVALLMSLGRARSLMQVLQPLVQALLGLILIMVSARLLLAAT